MAKYPGFCGGSHRSQSMLADCQRTVNLYPEIVQSEDAKVRTVLYPTPGLAYLTAGYDSKVGRGVFAQEGRCWVVSGTYLDEAVLVHTLGVASLEFQNRGAMATDDFPSTMTTNGAGGGQLFITSGGHGYILDLDTSVFTDVLATASMCGGDVINGRFLALDARTSTLWVGSLLNGIVWDPTMFVQRSTASDPWVSMLIVDDQIWLIGEKTGDIFYDAGNFPFPLAPREGLRIVPGIKAPYSLKALRGSPTWLSSDADGTIQVVRAKGYTPVPISTHALDTILRGYASASRVDDAVAYTYSEDGHYFYCLNFPTANATWVFDDTTNQWHERGPFNGKTGTYQAWGPQYHTTAFGYHIVSDHRSGSVFRFAPESSTDGVQTGGFLSSYLRRLRIPPGFRAEGRRLYVDRIELYLETGLGTGPGTLAEDPQAMLRTSWTGAKTWGSGTWRSAGKQGEYGVPVEWRGLGSGHDFVPEFSFTTPIPWRILDCSIDVRQGR